MQTANGSDARPLMKFVCLLIIITRALANITSPPHLFKNEKKRMSRSTLNVTHNYKFKRSLRTKVRKHGENLVPS